MDGQWGESFLARDGIFTAGILKRLLELGALTIFQAQIILKEHQQTQKTLEDLCVELGFVASGVMGPLLSELKGFPEANFSQMILDPHMMHQVPQDVYIKEGFIPLYQNDNEIGVALADVDNFTLRDKVVSLFPGKTLKFFLASRKNIVESVEQHYHVDCGLENLLQEI